MNPVYIVIPIFLVILGIIFTTNQYTALEIMILLFFIIVIGIVGTNYFLGIQLTTTLNNLFSKPEVDVAIVEPTESSDTQDTQDSDKTFKPQTYHINGQFDYSTAKEICKSYDGKLATLEDVKGSYENGAEWCDYGWSDKSMVLYPTQDSSWEKYQKTKNKEQCGIPGINGGYNNHVKQKLGVNCFGRKPNGTVTPLSPEKVDTRASYWQNQHLNVSPFNYTTWSEL
jgi:hypothetical protein